MSRKKKLDARPVTHPERKDELRKALREIFEAGVFNIDSHEQIELLIDKFRTSRTFIAQTYADWEKERQAATDENPIYIQAPPAKHRNEKVVIKGQTYYDVTDYIVDCGAYYGI